jgi:uncharacterized membrane protein
VTMDNIVKNDWRRAEQGGSYTSWSSRRSAAAVIALLFLIVQAVSCLIPPFQSPDEPAHLSRAYLLSRGELILTVHDGDTGGYIDSGLLTYMDLFNSKSLEYGQKISQADVTQAARIQWTDRRQFMAIPNTALYLPLPYLPQALAFTLGDHLRLSMQESYYLARFCSLAVTLALLYAALVVFPTPLMVLGLLVTPMSLYQLGSASLDAVTYGTCALAAALFFRATDLRYPFSAGMQTTLAVCLISLGASRMNMLPLTLLPAVLYLVRRSRNYLLSSAICLCICVAWTSFAAMTVKGLLTSPVSMLDTTKLYLAHPGSFMRIWLDTLGSKDVLSWYWAMFIGVLGWLDTPLDSYVYVLFGVLLVILAMMSLDRQAARWMNLPTALLLCAALLSILLTFSIELLAWTPYDARMILGIQGRYFTPFCILTAYAMFRRNLTTLQTRVGYLILGSEAALSIFSMAPKILHRYWIS